MISALLAVYVMPLADPAFQRARSICFEHGGFYEHVAQEKGGYSLEQFERPASGSFVDIDPYCDLASDVFESDLTDSVSGYEVEKDWKNK